MHFTGISKSKTDIEANIHLLSNEDEKETQRTGQRRMAISSPGCIEMFDKDQTPNTPVCMDNSVSSQTLSSSLMSSDQPITEAYESGRKPCFIGSDAGFIIYLSIFIEFKHHFLYCKKN